MVRSVHQAELCYPLAALLRLPYVARMGKLESPCAYRVKGMYSVEALSTRFCIGTKDLIRITLSFFKVNSTYR